MENEASNARFLTKLYTVTQVLGVLCVALVAVWVGHFRGGFGWATDSSDPKLLPLMFNWHPLLMTLGLVFLYANGALVYRGFRSEKKKKLKVVHALTMITALILVIVGLQAAFQFHNLSRDENGKKIPNMYTLHSWIGLSAVILFCLQWVCGLLTFLFPGLRSSLRASYLPVHQFFGMAIFLGAISSALLGLTEKIIFSRKDYKDFPAEGILVNVTGLVIIIFSGLVMYLLSNPNFKRRAMEDEVLLTDTVLE